MDRLADYSTELCHLCAQPFIPDAATADGLCSRCQQELIAACTPISVPHIDLEIPVVAATAYEGPIVALLESVKRRGHHRPLRFVARRMLPKVLESAPGPLYPIPASSRGKRSRGFDQMLVVAGHTGRPHQSLFLRRRGRQQKQLNRQLRLRNAESALTLHPRRGPRFSSGVIIDDVLTTGATVSRAVSLLQETEVVPTAVIVIAVAL
ncbi:MAG: hypothetical protein R6U25_08195 [Alkalispirochaeta sp.]